MDMIKSHFEKIMEQARKDGVKVELLISGSEKLNIGFQKTKLDSFESTQSQMAGLRVVLGGNQGYAYTENLSDESLLRTYREALTNAKTLQQGEGSGIPLQTPSVIHPIGSLYAPEDVTIEQKMEVARLLEEKGLAKDSRVHGIPYSKFNETVSFKRILNSEGVDQEFKQSYYSGYLYALAKEKEFSKMDGDGFFVRSFRDINLEKLTDVAVRKAVSRLGAKMLTTGNYPVVICRDQFPMILQMISSYFSAKEVHEGKSLFEGKLGQQIASEKFELIDDPFELKGTGVRPFDDEGAPSTKTTLIERGHLKNFLTNLEFAGRLSLPHTAHAARGPSSSMGIGPTNVVVARGTKTLQELLSFSTQVVYLTNFSGGLHAGFKESTGDFSMPAEGFLYENGKLVGPVDQFVMSGNVLHLLRDIVDLGTEYQESASSMICPDVLMRSLSFAGA